MIPAEREAYIIEELKTNGFVKVEELAERLNVTPMTIRRDLSRLEEQGIASRSHGGAVLQTSLEKEQMYDIKKLSNIEQKRKIAAAASNLVKDGDTVLIDAGTTMYELATLLTEKKDLTVVTTDLKVAMEINKSDHRLFFVGGQIQKETGSALGVMAEEFVAELQVDIAFIGTSAISDNWYLCTPTPEKATLKRKLITSAQRAVLLADHSKFHKNSFLKICSIGELDALITDQEFIPAELKELEEFGLEIIGIS